MDTFKKNIANLQAGQIILWVFFDRRFVILQIDLCCAVTSISAQLLPPTRGL